MQVVVQWRKMRFYSKALSCFGANLHEPAKRLFLLSGRARLTIVS
jgi:hypothetical protein